jgi:hypothetical protein
MNVNSLPQNSASDGDDATDPATTFDGFYALCGMCSFTTLCKPDYQEVKKLCDEHNAKNPGHDALPVNCVG